MIRDTNLADLYRETLLDHYHHPRNRRDVENATHAASLTNPVCGDNIRLILRAEDGRLADVAFLGRGCAVSTASASMLTTAVVGSDGAEARALSTDVRAMLKDGASAPERDDLEALAGVASAGRTACALLPWRVLDQLLDQIDAREGAT